MKAVWDLKALHLLCSVGGPPCPSLARLSGGALVHLVLPLNVLGSLPFSAGGGSLGGEAGTTSFVALDKSLILAPFYLLKEQGHGFPCWRLPVASHQGQSSRQSPP